MSTKILVSLLFIVTPLVRAAVPSDAEQFVRKIYAPYGVQSRGIYSSLGSVAHQRTIYSAGILALLKADAARTPKGYEGALGADPLCQCQDYDGIRVTEFEQEESSELHATIALALRFEGGQPPIVNLHLKLVKEAAGWRIDDIIPATGPSLRKILTAPKPQRKR